jgi:hypothetical protein
MYQPQIIVDWVHAAPHLLPDVARDDLDFPIFSPYITPHHATPKNYTYTTTPLPTHATTTPPHITTHHTPHNTHTSGIKFTPRMLEHFMCAPVSCHCWIFQHCGSMITRHTHKQTRAHTHALAPRAQTQAHLHIRHTHTHTHQAASKLELGTASYSSLAGWLASLSYANRNPNNPNNPNKHNNPNNPNNSNNPNNPMDLQWLQVPSTRCWGRPRGVSSHQSATGDRV